MNYIELAKVTKELEGLTKDLVERPRDVFAKERVSILRSHWSAAVNEPRRWPEDVIPLISRFQACEHKLDQVLGGATSPRGPQNYSQPAGPVSPRGDAQSFGHSAPAALNMASPRPQQQHQHQKQQHHQHAQQAYHQQPHIPRQIAPGPPSDAVPAPYQGATSPRPQLNRSQTVASPPPPQSTPPPPFSAPHSSPPPQFQRQPTQTPFSPAPPGRPQLQRILTMPVASPPPPSDSVSPPRAQLQRQQTMGSPPPPSDFVSPPRPGLARQPTNNVPNQGVPPRGQLQRQPTVASPPPPGDMVPPPLGRGTSSREPPPPPPNYTAPSPQADPWARQQTISPVASPRGTFDQPHSPSQPAPRGPPPPHSTPPPPFAPPAREGFALPGLAQGRGKAPPVKSNPTPEADFDEFYAFQGPKKGPSQPKAFSPPSQPKPFSPPAGPVPILRPPSPIKTSAPAPSMPNKRNEVSDVSHQFSPSREETSPMVSPRLPPPPPQLPGALSPRGPFNASQQPPPFQHQQQHRATVDNPRPANAPTSPRSLYPPPPADTRRAVTAEAGYNYQPSPAPYPHRPAPEPHTSPRNHMPLSPRGPPQPTSPREQFASTPASNPNPRPTFNRAMTDRNRPVTDAGPPSREPRDPWGRPPPQHFHEHDRQPNHPNQFPHNQPPPQAHHGQQASHPAQRQGQGQGRGGSFHPPSSGPPSFSPPPPHLSPPPPNSFPPPPQRSNNMGFRLPPIEVRPPSSGPLPPSSAPPPPEMSPPPPLSPTQPSKAAPIGGQVKGRVTLHLPNGTSTPFPFSPGFSIEAILREMERVMPPRSSEGEAPEYVMKTQRGEFLDPSSTMSELKVADLYMVGRAALVAVVFPSGETKRILYSAETTIKAALAPLMAKRNLDVEKVKVSDRYRKKDLDLHYPMKFIIGDVLVVKSKGEKKAALKNKFFQVGRKITGQGKHSVAGPTSKRAVVDEAQEEVEEEGVDSSFFDEQNAMTSELDQYDEAEVDSDEERRNAYLDDVALEFGLMFFDLNIFGNNFTISYDPAAELGDLIEPFLHKLHEDDDFEKIIIYDAANKPVKHWTKLIDVIGTGVRVEHYEKKPFIYVEDDERAYGTNERLAHYQNQIQY